MNGRGLSHPAPRSISRTARAACLTGFLLTVATTAGAQMSPGAENTTQGVGAGMDGAVAGTGGVGASIPIDLPSPRGSVPLPLAVVNTGSSRVGAAGQGWDIPISYVRRSTSTWRRKPYANELESPDDPQFGAERITLALGGQTYLMRAVGDVWWPARGEQFMELRKNGNEWSLKTLDNHEYIFRGDTPTGDGPLWVLREIRDLIGGDRVTLRYDVPAVGSCSAGLSLAGLAYSFDRSGTPLYEVDLEYQPIWRPNPQIGNRPQVTVCASRGDLDDEVAYPLERTREDTSVFIRGQVLHAIRLKARNNLVPSLASKVIRTYQLEYDVEPTTERPRLRYVSTTGEEGTGTTALPVARYFYGTLGWGEGDNVRLEYGAPIRIARPFASGATSYRPEMSTTVVSVSKSGDWRTERSRARHLIRDFTGDGLPDLLYKVGNTWTLHRNQLTTSGPQFSSQPMTWTQPAELLDQTTRRRTDDSRNARDWMITTETWSQFVDWDGDGRLDVIDVNGGSDQAHWKVWMNRRAADGTIAWTPTQIDILPLFGHLFNHGFVGLGDRVAIDRAKTWPRYDVKKCNITQCTPQGCAAPVECPDLNFPRFRGHPDTLRRSHDAPTQEVQLQPADVPGGVPPTSRRALPVRPKGERPGEGVRP